MYKHGFDYIGHFFFNIHNYGYNFVPSIELVWNIIFKLFWNFLNIYILYLIITPAACKFINVEQKTNSNFIWAKFKHARTRRWNSQAYMAYHEFQTHIFLLKFQSMLSRVDVVEFICCFMAWCECWLYYTHNHNRYFIRYRKQIWFESKTI